jgi:hypothetical protein
MTSDEPFEPRLRTVVIVTAIVALLVPLTLRLPGVVAAVRQAGVGGGVQPAFHINEATLVVRWEATDVAGPGDGCLFGLRLNRLDPLPGGPTERYVARQVPKLDYRFVSAGTTWRGDFGPRAWAAGAYAFTVDGDCAWQVSLEPPGPFAPPPSPDSPRLAARQP